MRVVVVFILLMAGMLSCNQSPQEKIKKDKIKISNASFFYVYDTIPKIYQYREIINGMYEQFHRVYGLRDGYGRHLIVERYTQEGRLTEAYNFNMDSLYVLDHMVVNLKGKKEKAFIYHNQLFPLSNIETHFATKFSGVLDSTVMLYEVFRKLNTFTEREVLNQNLDCMKLNERIRVTNIDLKSKKESPPMENQLVHYFGKGLGLIEWHDTKFSQHFVLEDIISQKAWINLISG